MSRADKLQNLGYWASEAAALYPDQIAIYDWANGEKRSLTHHELEQRLDAVAAGLQQHLALGARVAVAIGNRAEYVEAFFGAMRAGLVPVPMNLRQGPAQLKHVLEDAGCQAAIVDVAANPTIAGLVDERGIRFRIALDGERTGWTNFADAFPKLSKPFAPPSLLPLHPAMQPYTSGSTGAPKGVVLSHEGQIWWTSMSARLYRPGPDEISLVCVPLYHKNAMVGVVKSKLPGGGAMVLMPEFSARAFLANLAGFRCTHATGVPTIYSLALRETDLIETLDFSSLRLLTVGSAPVHPELRRTMERVFNVPVEEMYGLTEGGPVVFGPPMNGRPTPEGSCGTLWPECDAKLVNANGELAAAGELILRNPGVMIHYHNLPAITHARLKDGWLSTGDLFEVDKEGFWYFRGRTDDMFVCGGENVFPKEVEDILLRHPDVREVCVVPLNHETKGTAPVALVVKNSDSKLDEAALKTFAIEHGPVYAHPRRIVFTEAFPLNGAGKVDRGRIAKDMQASLGNLESSRL